MSQGRFGQVRKILTPPGFDPRTLRPVAIAIPTELPGPHVFLCSVSMIIFNPCGISSLIFVSTNYHHHIF